MKCVEPLVLPGEGFRTWLVSIAVLATLSGFAWSVGVVDGPLEITLILLALVGLPVVWLTLLSIWPMGLAVLVSTRHIRGGQYQAAAAYALLPVVAVAIAFLCGSTGYRMTQWSTTQIRLWRFSHAIEAAREAGQIVKTSDSWIDPGPPMRARFSLSSIGSYVIYAEPADVAWLNNQAKECRGDELSVPLGRNFFRIGGDC
jgi:hypothetical protein